MTIGVHIYQHEYLYIHLYMYYYVWVCALNAWKALFNLIISWQLLPHLLLLQLALFLVELLKYFMAHIICL